MTFTNLTIKKFENCQTKEAFLCAQLTGFDGNLTEFCEQANKQLQTEWSARDKRTADHFNY